MISKYAVLSKVFVQHFSSFAQQKKSVAIYLKWIMCKFQGVLFAQDVWSLKKKKKKKKREGGMLKFHYVSISLAEQSICSVLCVSGVVYLPIFCSACITQ
jgi:hypothetical protein